MTEVTSDVTAPSGADQAQDTPAKRARKGTGLSGMVLAELHQLAGSLGITGTSKMRKSDLIEAISARQGNGGGQPAHRRDRVQPAGGTDVPAAQQQPTEARSRSAATSSPAPEGDQQPRSAETGERPTDAGQNRDDRQQDHRASRDERQQDPRAGRDENPDDHGDKSEQDSQQRQDRRGNRDRQNNQNNQGGGNRDNQGKQNNQNNQNSNQNNQNSNQNQNQHNDDDDGSGRGRRRRRGRDRYRDRDRDRDRGGRGNNRNQGGRDEEPQVSEDDVLVPIAGILDVLDNYAFVRTSGYLTGSNDVYVSLSQVRKYGLRRGDAITGAVKAPREGERREKYNALVRLDTINGLEPDAARNRPEFTKLTPLYPQRRLRLETEASILTTRIIDLVMPIGKGQRALIVSPPKAGKTSVLQAIANAITTNNPECHLMVVLVDERPEEVTDMQRSVKGEVIASTFDRPPQDHTTVAELSIERAKRLVELGHDVVVLLDSITRLGRAYNLAAPTSGRILSGGVDSTALYPPKRFLGAARNIENGGSLTIIATALVETGSMMDTVIFEEFKGTGNAELKLDRKIADKRVFPAVDVDASGTRKEEILLSRDELAIIIKLRRVLGALDPIEAIDLLISRLKKTQNNAEFLMQIAKSTPGKDDD